MSEEEFKELMTSDLQGVVDSMPKGNNAWTIIVMVSKHSWVDGKRQPIYSKQWGKVYDPFPNNPNANEGDIAYQVSSIVGSRATSQKIYDDTFKSTGEMITYSFTMMSWKSQEYANGEGESLEGFHQSELNFSEEGYQGEDYLTRLIMSVKTPQPKLPSEEPDQGEPEADEQGAQTGELETITCEEYKSWQTSPKLREKRCPAIVTPYDRRFIWCAEDFGDLTADQYMERHPPTYARNFDLEECN
ncbi:MAG: hypothetical protein HYU49_00575 [Candidatus Levybacteria bacterium]|nr:hypothetical protein [Candidatus Levybacteria bacterium]